LDVLVPIRRKKSDQKYEQRAKNVSQIIILSHEFGTLVNNNLFTLILSQPPF